MADDTTQAGTGGADGMAGASATGFQDRVAGASEAMRNAGQTAMESGATISMKLIDQAERNARDAFAAMRAAASARDMAEVMRIQAEYLRDQSGRAMAQAREIGELIAQYGQNAASTMRDGGTD